MPSRPNNARTAPTIAFTGGGTGGHVYPGLAVVQALREKGFEGRITWIGSKKESDRSAVEGAGVEFFAVPSGKLRRELSPANVADAFRVLAGYVASRRELKKIRPALLFSKGGYVSVPPCAAAASLGIPYFTHESDLTPGLATRLNAKRASRIILSYEETRGLLGASSRAKAVVAGNPIRPSIRRGDAAKGRAILSVPGGLPVVFFLGGSQGARQINELVEACLPELTKLAFVVHQAGGLVSTAASEGGGSRVVPAAAPPSFDAARYRRFQYIRDEMPDILAAADLVVGRAGAGTLWESAALGKPMLLVPLCGVGTRGDQVDNAALFERSGAAVSLVGDAASPERLLREARELLGDPARLGRMGASARALGGVDAAAAIADLILQTIGEGS
jgi:UDP-N-acetylglucosamine--N-acetylmuramyl-(pentapeptide) pyrophosphoryl-undecaprenol N-acetylglucosamine transferase